MKKFFAILTLLILPILFFPPTASAQFKPWDSCTEKITDPATGKTADVATLRCVPVLFQNVVSAFLIFIGVVALFMILYSGIKLITSGGDPKQVQAARQIMTYAIIGAVVVLSSFAIIYFIGYITNSSDCITNLDNIKSGGCK